MKSELIYLYDDLLILDKYIEEIEQTRRELRYKINTIQAKLERLIDEQD